MVFFFYGSLTDADVLATVIGRSVDPADCEPAVAPGWRRARVSGAWYPMLVRGSGHTVDGMLVRGLGPAELVRLLAYEGRPYQVRSIAAVGSGSGAVQARVFMARPGVRAAGDWRRDGFERRQRPRILARQRGRVASADTFV